MLDKISKYLSKLSNFFSESSDKISKLDKEVQSEISKEKFKFGFYGLLIGFVLGLIFKASF